MTNLKKNSSYKGQMENLKKDKSKNMTNDKYGKHFSHKTTFFYKTENGKEI